MKKVLSSITLLIIILLNGYAQQKTYNIVAYGAVGDGKTNNTLEIQKTIDAAAATGGGQVVIPAGKFVTGVIYLKSNVELHLSKDATLLGSTKRIDYGPHNASALIEATNQHHISITGKGTIDGQGEELLKDIYVMLNAGTLEDKEWKTYNPWHQMRPEERNRPKIIFFLNCDSIKVKGITIKNGLCWVQDYRNSSNILIDSIQVESNIFWNNDGIDLTDCKNAKITNCSINADDDGICLKSSDRKSRCENIYVGNCKVRSSASAIKFGTASWGGFKNITIRDITVYDTYRSAIAIECVDGGILEDIDVRNIKATNTGNALFIRLGHRNTDTVYSQLQNVHISDIRVEIPATKPDAGYPMEGPILDAKHHIFPSSVTGIPGHPVKNVIIENVDLIYQGSDHQGLVKFSPDSMAKIPERISSYPEFSMFGELPAWGFYVRHVEGLVMKNIKMSLMKPDYRSAALFDDVAGLKLEDINIPYCNTLPAILFSNTQNTELKELKVPQQKNKDFPIK
jgi:parallel beta-helix repeat protein